MPSRFIDPFAQFLDSNGNPLNGGTLTFYATGTSTKIDTYSDQDLSTANANPVTLDSAGRLPNAVFLLARDYKVVLANSVGTQIWSADPVAGEPVEQAATELTISAGSVTPILTHHTIDTESDAASDDLANIATTNLRDGMPLTISAANAARTVVVKDTAGGAGQIHTADGKDISLTDTNQYVLLRRDGADWYEIARSGNQPSPQIANEYRLYDRPLVLTSTGAGTYNPSSTAVRLIEVVLIGAGGGVPAAPSTGAGQGSTCGGGGGGSGINFFLPIDGSSYSASYTVPAGVTGADGSSATWNDGTVNVSAGGGNVSSTGGPTSGNTLAQRGAEGQPTLTNTTGARVVAAINGSDGTDGMIIGGNALVQGGYGGASAFGYGMQLAGAVSLSSSSTSGSEGKNYGGGASSPAIGASDGGGGSALAGGQGIIIVYEYV